MVEVKGNRMTGKKICFFDIDGTLTDERGGAVIRVPESTREALQKAHDAGVLLFVNTGRPISTVPQIIKELPLDGFVCACGTWIMMHGNELFRHVIEEQERQHIMRTVDELQISCVYEAKEGFAFVDHCQHGPMMEIVKTYIKDGFKLLDVHPDLVFEKFCLFVDPAKGWPDLSFVDQYDKIFKYGYFCETVPLACSKGKAVEYLLKELKISHENSYGFGDSVNDVEMLKAVHHSVVMDNAPDEVKALGTYLAEKASEDGLYKVMVHLGLIEEEA